MMTTFDFYFCSGYPGRAASELDRQGRTLQDSSNPAAQGNRLTQDVVKTLLKDRTDIYLIWFFFNAWFLVVKNKEHLV